MKTICQRCKTKLDVQASMADRQVRCPTCEFVFVAVESSTEHEPKKNLAENDSSGLDLRDGGAIATENVLAETPHLAVENEWFLETPEGYEFGPISRSQLDTWVSEGRVDGECKIRNRGNAEWVAPESVYTVLDDRGNPFSVPKQQSADAMSSMLAHRGPLILGLAFAGCVIPFLSVWPAILGTRDLRLMSLGKMDLEGDAMTRAGQVIGMVSSMIWIGAAAFVFLAILITFMK